MSSALNYIQILLALVLLVLILVQVKGTGGGLFGQATSTFRTRRGIEQTLYRATILVSVIFVLMSLLSARFAG